MTAPGVLRVALDMPLGRLFDYLPPPPLAADFAIEPGVRVGVPFGRQRLVGVVMESARCSDVPAERLKAVLQVLDPIPVFDRSALELLSWAAEYYHHPIGQVLAAALPKALRLGAGVRANEERWVATAEGREALTRGEPRRASARARPAGAGSGPRDRPHTAAGRQVPRALRHAHGGVAFRSYGPRTAVGLARRLQRSRARRARHALGGVRAGPAARHHNR